MLFHPLQQPRVTGLGPAAAVLLLGLAAFPGRAESTGREPALPGNSPAPECLPAREAWRVAESHAASIPGGDVMMGSGGSMMPLYPDRTVMVVQRLPMADLHPGMTVVFIGDSGRPVAHTLVSKTPRGWTAKGLANDHLDLTLVRAPNYLGTVVRAFVPVVNGPATALARRPMTTSGFGTVGSSEANPWLASSGVTSSQ
jgi:hypothetical protein